MVAQADEIESEGTHLVDFRLIANLLGYTRGAVRRHRRLAVSLFLGVAGVVITSVLLLPKTYHVETRLLAQKNPALTLKGDLQNDNPTRAAADVVKRRENLIALVRQTDLIHEWYTTRAPLPRLKDAVMKAVSKPETEQETTEWMADVLEKRLTVMTPNDTTIMIALDWPDPTMGLRLVNAAQQNYLESRQATEITAIAEQIAILQNHATALRADIDAAVDAIEQLRAERLAKPTASSAPATAPPSTTPKPTAPSSPPPMARRSSEPDPELAQLKVSIEAKQRAISDLEEFRRRRLSELNASLAEKRATYTDDHPTIIDLKQTIASLSTESPQVQVLRADVDRLQKEFDQKSAAAAAEQRAVPVINTGSTGGTPPPLPGSIIRIEQEPSDERDPSMMYARSRLRDAMDKYSMLRAQIEAAQIDFDTAEAAFKYRYSVIDPPSFPKKPIKPNVPLVALSGILGGMLVAIFAAVAVDLRRGRFVERWQVERELDLPTLAEIDLATLAEHKIE